MPVEPIWVTPCIAKLPDLLAIGYSTSVGTALWHHRDEMHANGASDTLKLLQETFKVLSLYRIPATKFKLTSERALLYAVKKNEEIACVLVTGMVSQDTVIWNALNSLFSSST